MPPAVAEVPPQRPRLLEGHPLDPAGHALDLDVLVAVVVDEELRPEAQAEEAGRVDVHAPGLAVRGEERVAAHAPAPAEGVGEVHAPRDLQPPARGRRGRGAGAPRALGAVAEAVLDRDVRPRGDVHDDVPHLRLLRARLRAHLDRAEEPQLRQPLAALRELAGPDEVARLERHRPLHQLLARPDPPARRAPRPRAAGAPPARRSGRTPPPARGRGRR